MRISIPRHLTIRSSRPRIVASTACYTLRLHAVAAPLWVGLTQALGLMKTLLLTSILLLAGGCTTPAPVSVLALPQTEQQCVAEGHRWVCNGIPGEGCPMICVMRTTDAGKICTDTSQCQGACIASDQYARNGTCSAQSSIGGCQFYLDSQRRPGGPKICD